MLQRLNPFRGLPNPREAWAWGMYDLANQSFTLLIVTLFFAIYLKNHVAPDQQTGALAWGLAGSISSLIVVLTAPLFGALADFGGRKKAWLMVLGVGCSLLTMLLALIPPHAPGAAGSMLPLVAAMAVYIGANVMFMGGENFLAAFLPELATRETLNRVSAIGWTMGYIGAMLVLPVAAVILLMTDMSPAGFRWVFVFAGAWFLVNSIPTMLFLRERKQPEPLPPGRTLLSVGFARVAQTVREGRRIRQLARFLAAFFVYSMGMNAVIAFAGDLAFQYLGKGMLIFVWVLALISAVGSASTGLLRGMLGDRGLLAGSLVVWVATTIGAALLPPPPASPPAPTPPAPTASVTAPLAAAGAGQAAAGAVAPGSGGPPAPLSTGVLLGIWGVGAGMGLGLGLTGNASRTVVGLFTPSHKSAEFFGLWGLSYKLAAVVSLGTYGAVYKYFGQQWSMGLVAVCFVAGLGMLAFVDMAEGRRRAEELEREFAGGAGKPAADPPPG